MNTPEPHYAELEIMPTAAIIALLRMGFASRVVGITTGTGVTPAPPDSGRERDDDDSNLMTVNSELACHAEGFSDAPARLGCGPTYATGCPTLCSPYSTTSDYADHPRGEPFNTNSIHAAIGITRSSAYCNRDHTRLHDLLDGSPSWRRRGRAAATVGIIGVLRRCERGARDGEGLAS